MKYHRLALQPFCRIYRAAYQRLSKTLSFCSLVPCSWESRLLSGRVAQRIATRKITKKLPIEIKANTRLLFSDANRIPQSGRVGHRQFDVKESKCPHEHPNAKQPRGLPESLAPFKGRPD